MLPSNYDFATITNHTDIELVGVTADVLGRKAVYLGTVRTEVFTLRLRKEITRGVYTFPSVFNVPVADVNAGWY